MAFRIALITTQGRNPGDERIADGVKSLVSRFTSSRDIRFSHVNKHDPLSMYLLWRTRRRRPIRHLPGFLPPLLNLTRANKLARSDLVIHCGTPVFWPGCAEAGWVRPILHQTLARLDSKIPVVNLGIGASYPWLFIPDALVDDEVSFARTLTTTAEVTTVRDKATQTLLSTIGESFPLIACPSIFFAGHRVSRPERRVKVILNFMRIAGHYDGGQRIDEMRWRTTFAEILHWISESKHSPVFICHSDSEMELARTIASNVPRYKPTSGQELWHHCEGASIGIVNRLHVALPLAGIGVPSIVIGNDSRLLMGELLGLPCLFVDDVRAGDVIQLASRLLDERVQVSEHLLSQRARAEDRYRELMRGVLA